MAGKRNKKVVKYRKPIHINIGVIIFGIIFLYIVYYAFSYFTEEHISVYEVTQGTIAQNNSFTGLILREETVYYAKDSGYLNYYNKDGTKAGYGTYVYSVDETGDFYSRMTEANDGTLMISDESYEKLENTTDQYLTNYSDQNFYQVYQYKYDMESNLAEAVSLSVLNQMGEDAKGLTSTDKFHLYAADRDGVVVYHTDGMEEVTVDSFTKDMFDPAAYQKNNLSGRETVSSGDAVFKLISSEIWNVVIPIEESLAIDLAEEKNIKVQFQKDNSAAWASSQILKKDGASYLNLTFQNSMVRFATDRYVDLELVLSDSSGLKIPNTSIVSKDFLTVPKEYITKGGDSDSDGVLKEVTDKKGKTLTEFVKTTLFHETDTEYYIDAEDISGGDTIIMPDSNKKYTLKKSETLQGVYNINKGYAIFKQIEILFQNQEYTIVKNGTSYGITLYDHIALDGSIVHEDDIVH